MEYDSWMALVNDVSRAQIGIEVDHLVDWCWNAAFTSGSTPKEAVCDYFDECYPEYADIMGNLCN